MGLFDRFFKPSIDQLKQTRDIAALTAALAASEEGTRLEAATALGDLRPPDAVTPLIAALRDTSWPVRGAAAQALGAIGSREAATHLLPLLGDDNDRVRQAAAVALGRIDDPRAVNTLASVLSDEAWEFNFANPAMRSAMQEMARTLFGTTAGADPRECAADLLERLGGSTAQQALASYRSTHSPIAVPAAFKGREVEAVMVLSRARLENPQSLLQRIVDHLRSHGHPFAPSFRAALGAAGDSMDDAAYIYAKLRTEFSSLGAHDLVERTVEFTFRASDGNPGKYLVVFAPSR